MLDQEDGDPAPVDGPDELDDALRLGVGEARHHLVEQQQPRLGAERPRQLEPLALGQRQPAGRPIGLGAQPELVEHGAGAPLGLGDVGVAAERGDHHVAHDGEARKRSHDLKRPGEAERVDLVRRQPAQVAAGEGHPAGVGGEEPGDEREGRRLASAVGADQRHDLALGHREIEVLHRLHAAEPLAEADDI